MMRELSGVWRANESGGRALLPFLTHRSTRVLTRGPWLASPHLKCLLESTCY